MKRACDSCISRKVRCDGAHPCRSCLYSSKKVDCTYLKPARKRGPKSRRISLRPAANAEARCTVDEELDAVFDASQNVESQSQVVGARCLDPATVAGSLTYGEVSWNITDLAANSVTKCVSVAILETIILEYRSKSYNVWPVVKAEALLERVSDSRDDPGTYCLATALCAATMAQLDLPPMDQDRSKIDSAMLAGECIRVREQSHYREHLDLRSVLASFFLHVYHAKVNKRHSALIFIQEAISCARLLRLDCDEIMSDSASGVVDNEDILFLLLWVSERGYAMHLGLSPSYADIVKLPDANNISDNVHVQGLLELARLFVAFAQCFSSNSSCPFTDTLVTTEDFLHGLSMQRDQAVFVRLADYHITKEWMRTIIWQQALSLGLLSSTSYNALMTFTFPSYVGRDLLSSLKDYHSEDLLPLGRDQLLKCFEVANSLADTLLCNPTVSANSCFRLGPQEFLHGLYQKLAPFLEQDPILNSILRQKTAEALLRAPSRLWTLDVESAYEDVMDDEQHGSGKYRPVNLTSHTPAY